MEDSQSDLAGPPRSAPPFPVPAPGGTTAGSFSVPLQELKERQPGFEDRELEGEDYRAKGAVHGAGIEGFEQKEVGVVQQEGLQELCNGALGGVGVAAESDDGDDVMIDDRIGLMDVGGGDDDEDAATRQVAEFDDFMPLGVAEGVAGEGFQFGQVAGVLDPGGAGGLPLPTESGGGDEPWIAQSIDTANYGMGNDGDSIFEAAIRDIINKSSQGGAGYDHAESEVVVLEEEMEGLGDGTEQLHSAPAEASDSMLFTIDDVEGGSGHQEAVGLPQDVPGISDFVASVGVDVSVSDQELFATEDETEYAQVGRESAESLHVGAIPVSEDVGHVSSPAKYSTDALGDGSDCLQGVSWPAEFEQELYPPLQHDPEFVLDADAHPHEADEQASDDNLGVEAEEQSSDILEVEAEKQPSDNAEVEVEVELFDNPEVEAEDQPSDNLEVDAGEQPPDNPEVEAEEQPSEKPEVEGEEQHSDHNNSQVDTGEQHSHHPEVEAEEEQASDNSEVEEEEQPSDNPEVEAEEQPSDNAEIEAEEQPSDNAEIEAEEQVSDNPEVASEAQDGAENVLAPLDNKRSPKSAHFTFTEESEDGLRAPYEGTSDLDEALDSEGGFRAPADGTSDLDEALNSGDRAGAVQESGEEGNVGDGGQEERGASVSSPMLSNEDGVESNGAQLPLPNEQPNASNDGGALTTSAEAPKEQSKRPVKKHQGNGARVTFAHSKASDKSSGKEKLIIEGPKEGDGLPLWVKWRGKWEAAIRCSDTDCPPTTLKARPNYSKKKHVVVYFPSARLFSWVDTQHTSPIEESPVPLLTGTHESQRGAVSDEFLPRRRMLLKLGGEILDISDRLHIKAVTEVAQDVNVWKTFATEAAAATTYAELGELLVRLHLTIAPVYIKCRWISLRHAHWKDDCSKAGSASVLQKLTKELINAVRWEDVAPLWNAAEQPELDPAWEHWKGDAFEENDSDDNDTKVSKAPGNKSSIGSQKSAASGSKRFKEQARARRKGLRSPDPSENSSQKRPKTNPSSPEVRSSGRPSGSSNVELATTAFRSPLVHLSRVTEDKDVGVSSGGLAVFYSGLCSAYLKRKSRRCNRPAKEDISYCGKHKSLADPENAGQEDLETEGGLAWESGLCSASLGAQFSRCEESASEGSMFCQTHLHLASTVQTGSDKNIGEVHCSAAPKEDERCQGITTRGIQCTHKPHEGSSFCAKHVDQSNELAVESEGRRILFQQQQQQGLEGSASKRARIPMDTATMNGTPVQVPVSSHHTIPVAHGNGLMQRGSITPSPAAAGTDASGSRKRKWVSSFINRQQSALNVKSPLSQGQDVPTTAANLPRCKGRTTRNDDQCSFRARPGHSLCTKHLLASEGGKKLLLEEESKLSSDSSAASDARALLEKYLKSTEDVPSDPASDDLDVKKQQLLKTIRAEAAHNYFTAEELLKLVTVEMSKLEEVLRPSTAFPTDNEEMKGEMKSILPVLVNGNGQSSHLPGITTTRATRDQTCGLCGLMFVSQEHLFKHWRDSHRKEVVLFVKGYACRQCGQLYSRKHTVRRHWKKRHQSLPVRSPDWLAVCWSCKAGFESHDSLLQHVCAAHPELLSSPDLRTSAIESRAGVPVEPEAMAAESLECDDCHEEFNTHWDLFHHKERSHKSVKSEVISTKGDSSSGGDTKLRDNGDPSSKSEAQLFGCRNCNKKFPSLAELGSHAEAEHPLPAGPSGKSSSLNSSDCGRVKLQVRRKSEEKVSGIWQTAAMGPRRSKKRGRFQRQASEKNVDKDAEKDALLLRMKAAVQTAQLRGLRQSKRADVPAARPRKALYSLTKGGQMLPFDTDSNNCEDFPEDKELLDMAQSVCCQSKLLTTLHQKFVKLPDQLLVRVSQVCTQANVKLEWLADGFLCPSNCNELRMAMDTAEESIAGEGLVSMKVEDSKLEGKDVKEEVGKSLPNSGHLDFKPRSLIISPDLSNGLEPVPVVCSVEQDVVDNWRRTHKDATSSSETFRPDSFNYITDRALNPSLGVDPENYKVGCSCEGPQCTPESCDHVDIFDNDNLEALDIYGEPMKGRFPYDSNGCIILEEGYLVYECNSSCHCQQACQNRVLQKGVTVKLEVFRTLQKGWAVRAAQKIPRGTFVCEYLGEVLHDEEANRRGERYDQVGCSYLYDIDAHLDTTGRIGRSKPFVIDATKHGNVARFINHSCAPNLVNYQVLVDSMDCQLAHIGLFASRDIENGEELAYDYRYKLLPGKGCPCHCGASNCRGRLY